MGAVREAQKCTHCLGACQRTPRALPKRRTLWLTPTNERSSMFTEEHESRMSGTGGKSQPTPTERALRQQFLLGMSHAACTVNVVTTDGVAGRHGVTVSAMVSVSADTPQPTLLVCIHHLSPVIAAVLKNGVFCVNVLRDDQSHISDNFAGRSSARGAAKFDCATWTTQLTGAPPRA